MYVYKFLDNQDCKAVRIFTVDFSKWKHSIQLTIVYSLQSLSS